MLLPILGVMFVVDCADRERIPEAREELLRLLESPEMRNVPLVVIANKQDLPGKLRSGFYIYQQTHEIEKNHN